MITPPPGWWAGYEILGLVDAKFLNLVLVELAKHLVAAVLFNLVLIETDQIHNYANCWDGLKVVSALHAFVKQLDDGMV